MPWLTIVIFLLSYFMAKKTGASKGQAALMGAVAAGAAYMTIEPTNAEAIFNDKLYGDDGVFPGVDYAGKYATAEKGNTGVYDGTNAKNSGISVLGDVAKKGISSITDLAKSWGPLGTTAAVGGIGAIFSGDNKWLWLAGGAALLLVMTK